MSARSPRRITTQALLGVTLAALSNIALAVPVYLNYTNITVSLGPTMSAEPFANRTTADSLASIIDAESATSVEFHTQTTHVWVSGGPLELVFDFGAEYNLSMLHFWNYHSEGYDVDTIAFTFFDESLNLVGSLTESPRLGNTNGSDGTPITPEDYALAFPTNVRFVNALLTGTNNQVDFNNIGFTAELSNPTDPDPDPEPEPEPGPVNVPEPAPLAVLGLGLALFGLRRRVVNS